MASYKNQIIGSVCPLGGNICNSSAFHSSFAELYHRFDAQLLHFFIFVANIFFQQIFMLLFKPAQIWKQKNKPILLFQAHSRAAIPGLMFNECQGFETCLWVIISSCRQFYWILDFLKRFKEPLLRGPNIWAFIRWPQGVP